MKMQLLVASTLLLSFSYKSYEPGQTLDTHMSPQEHKESGVHKLTPEEKKSLQQWINRNHYVRPGAKRYDKTYPEVSEVIGNGAYVKLSDGSIWQIHPSDRLLTQSWISAAAITVEKNGSSTYGFTLKNNLTGSSVRAEKVSTIPKYMEHSRSKHFHKEEKKNHDKTAPKKEKTSHSALENPVESASSNRPPEKRAGEYPLN